MTISTEVRIAGPFPGNDIQTVFPFAFKAFAKADLFVIKTDALGIEITTGAGLVLDLDYSVALNADQDASPGGNVTYPLGGSSFPTLPTGEKLTLTTAIPEKQETDLPSGGPWNPKVIENAVDKVTMLVQQLSQDLDRVLRGPLSDPAIKQLPNAAARALKFGAYDAAGDPIAATSVTGTPVTAFSATLLDDLTVADWLTTLGFSAFMQTLRLDTTAAAARTTLEVPSKAEIQNGATIYALDTGTANAVLLAMAPSVATYAEGQKFRSHKLVTNTGACTIDIDGLGPVALNAPDGTPLLSGQLAAGQPFEVIRHTSSQFRVVSAFPTAFGSSIQSVLKDPTITRDTADSFTVGAFQASPLGAVVPLVSTSANLVRQATGLFERSAASAPKGISEQTGALAVAAEFTATDVSFTATTAINAASGTPFSNFAAGDKIVVDGSSLNEGTFEVATLVGGGTGVTVVEAIVTESAGASITIYRIPRLSTLHLHAVRETATGNVAIAADDNIAGSNIGSGASVGWVQVRRLWSLKMNGSTDIRDGIKLGNHWTYAAIANDLSTGSVSALLTATLVPTGFSVLWHGGLGVNTTSSLGNSRAEVQLSSGLLSAAHPANRPNVPGHHCIGSVTSFSCDGGTSVSNIQTDTSGRIRSKMTITSGSAQLYSFYTEGYTDERIA